MKVLKIKAGSENVLNKAKGFTLIEVITTMVIMGIIGVMFVDAMVNTAKTLALFNERKETVYMINFALRRMLKDCRYVKRTGIITANSKELTYNDSFGRKVSFKLNSAKKSIEMNVNDGNYYTLAERISNLTIQYYNKLSLEFIPTVITIPDIHSFKITIEVSGALLSYKKDIIVFPREMFR